MLGSPFCISLYHLQFPSLMFYIFQSIDLLPLWLHLFLAIFFFLISKWIVFLIPVSDSSLLVYRKAIDFCILILYPATLLNSLITANRFLVDNSGLSVYNMSSENHEFYFFPSNLDAFYFFIFSCCCG